MPLPRLYKVKHKVLAVPPGLQNSRLTAAGRFADPSLGSRLASPLSRPPSPHFPPPSRRPPPLRRPQSQSRPPGNTCLG